MDWDMVIDIDINEKSGTLTLSQIFSELTANLGKDDIEEFADQLIKWVEIRPTPSSLLE
jgi:hypothetical protein